MEVVLTAGLVNTILGRRPARGTLDERRHRRGRVYCSGRTLGGAGYRRLDEPGGIVAPDLVRGDFHTTWIYVVGPMVGAMIGVAFERILKGKPTAAGSDRRGRHSWCRPSFLVGYVSGVKAPAVGALLETVQCVPHLFSVCDAKVPSSKDFNVLWEEVESSIDTLTSASPDAPVAFQFGEVCLEFTLFIAQRLFELFGIHA